MNNFQTFSAVNTSISNMQRISQYHAREALDTHEDAVSVDETSVNGQASTSSNHSLYNYVGLFLCMTLGACVASIMNKE